MGVDSSQESAPFFCFELEIWMELTASQMAALRLPRREPVFPFCEVAWFEREGADEQSEPDEQDAEGQGRSSVPNAPG
jgi:hypothetical protein